MEEKAAMHTHTRTHVSLPEYARVSRAWPRLQREIERNFICEIELNRVRSPLSRKGNGIYLEFWIHTQTQFHRIVNDTL